MAAVSRPLRCFRCGMPAEYLVTARYSPLFRPGRLMAYCDECRSWGRDFIGVAIPLEIATLDLEVTLLSLYEGCYTQTSPEVVADLFGIAPGDVMDEVRRSYQRKGWAVGSKVPASVLERHHVNVATDKGWQQWLRLGQALWREQQGFSMGKSSRGTAYGNYVDAEYAERTWCNFMSPTAKVAAQRELDNPSRGRLMQRSRMLTNLLGSQPLCFNFFADLGADLDLASQWGRRMWPGRVERITGIKYEYSPGRGDARYLDTFSAFDVFVTFETPKGEAGFIGIEVKYFEDLTESDPDIRQRAVDVAKASGTFVAPESDRLSSQPLSQIYLDHLLALSMLQADREWADGFFVFLYPEANMACKEALYEYQRELEPTDTFQAITMDAALALLPPEADTGWAEAFKDRYLTYSIDFELQDGED